MTMKGGDVMAVTVYTQDNCSKCNGVMMYLNLKCEVVEKNVSRDVNFLEEAYATGLSDFPIIVADGHEPFSGFKPEELIKIA